MEPKRLLRDNDLLDALQGATRMRVFDRLELVELALGEVLCEAGESFSYAHFPVDSIASILYVMKNTASAEIAVVGKEGMIGVSLFMGGDSTSSRVIVQNAGHAYRMKAKDVQTEFARGGPFQQILLRFVQSLITQMVQTAACNRHHTVDQQFCRWLLMSLDRLPTNELRMTQRLIGNMLGIDNAGVQAAAEVLSSAGLIEYDDGDIRVVSRPGVVRRSCECYGVVKKECDRLLSMALTPAAAPVAVGH